MGQAYVMLKWKAIPSVYGVQIAANSVQDVQQIGHSRTLNFLSMETQSKLESTSDFREASRWYLVHVTKLAAKANIGKKSKQRKSHDRKSIDTENKINASLQTNSKSRPSLL